MIPRRLIIIFKLVCGRQIVAIKAVKKSNEILLVMALLSYREWIRF